MARWLLVLGSDAGSEAPIEAALAALAQAGTLRRLTPARRTRDDDGGERDYLNLLAELDCGLSREALLARIHGIERDVGRPQRRDAVVIDIDLLAAGAGGTWRLDAHAAAKGEHGKRHVRLLLREAGIDLDG